MIITMASVLVLVIVQAWIMAFSFSSTLVLSVFIVLIGFVVAQLKKKIDGINQAPSEGEIGDVRRGLGALALLYHQGLAAAFTTLLFQYGMIIISGKI